MDRNILLLYFCVNRHPAPRHPVRQYLCTADGNRIFIIFWSVKFRIALVSRRPVPAAGASVFGVCILLFFFSAVYYKLQNEYDGGGGGGRAADSVANVRDCARRGGRRDCAHCRRTDAIEGVGFVDSFVVVFAECFN